jgi:hypothetical protein
MKHIRLVLALSVTVFLATFTAASADTFDSATATIQKGGPHTAKIMIKKDTYTAPVTFDDGADWSTVKDHYEVDDKVITGLQKNAIAIKIGSDGTASFTHKK